MNKLLIVSSIAAACAAGGTAASAEELGRVLSTTPVLQQVAVPRQVCSVQQVATQPQKSGAGAVMGGIAGGAMGNAVGQGGGRAVATMLGIFGGAILGNSIEGSPAPQVHNVQQCSTQTFYENRTVAYNVTYEYAGKQYSVQMPQDPGPHVRLQITPVGGTQMPSQMMQPMSAAPAAPIAPVAYPVAPPGAMVPPPGSAPAYPPATMQQPAPVVTAPVAANETGPAYTVYPTSLQR